MLVEFLIQKFYEIECIISSKVWIMPDNKIYFIGLLSNTDSSILKVKLQKGFEINCISYEEVVDGETVLGAFMNMKKYHELTLFGKDLLSPEDNNFYFITNSFDAMCDLEQKRYKGLDAIAKFENENLDYLHNTLRLMRLFKEGNIHMPISHNFTISNEKPKGLGSTGTILYNSDWPTYSLEAHEVTELQQFLENTKLPLNDFVKLAFENFELSYYTHKRELAFLSLMIALEVLFNRGKEGELGYSIARNAAVLLGDDKDHSEEVYRKIKELYAMRGAIVHSGETSRKKPLREGDLLILRDYVRRSIKEICAFDKSKDYFIEILNSNGYGSKPLGIH
jgi:hypothetical protein